MTTAVAKADTDTVKVFRINFMLSQLSAKFHFFFSTINSLQLYNQTWEQNFLETFGMIIGYIIEGECKFVATFVVNSTPI